MGEDNLLVPPVSPHILVRDWMIKFKRDVDQEFNDKDILLCYNIIKEEFKEVVEELHYETEHTSKGRLTKELCDLIWVCYFTGAKFGLPMDVAFQRVYDSNMSKLGEDGKPILREDGKILKGTNYKPADLKDLF